MTAPSTAETVMMAISTPRRPKRTESSLPSTLAGRPMTLKTAATAVAPCSAPIPRAVAANPRKATIQARMAVSS